MFAVMDLNCPLARITPDKSLMCVRYDTCVSMCTPIRATSTWLRMYIHTYMDFFVASYIASMVQSAGAWWMVYALDVINN